jgi:hypothetical protein
MQRRVPITLQIVNPHEPPVPAVSGFDLFCVLEGRDRNLTVPDVPDYHLTLPMAQRIATDYMHTEAQRLCAYLVEALRRWATTGQV